jgi:hypothetical protein
MIHPLRPSVAQRVDHRGRPTEALRLIPRDNVADHQCRRVEPTVAVDHEVRRSVIVDRLRWRASALTRQTAALPTRPDLPTPRRAGQQRIRLSSTPSHVRFSEGGQRSLAVTASSASSSEGFDYGRPSFDGKELRRGGSAITGRNPIQDQQKSRPPWAQCYIVELYVCGIVVRMSAPGFGAGRADGLAHSADGLGFSAWRVSGCSRGCGAVSVAGGSFPLGRAGFSAVDR